MPNPIPAIAIFDVGKTNKKLLLFDREYKLLYESSGQFPELVDEDGFPCENIGAIAKWIKHSLAEIILQDKFEVVAINVSAYGASFVHVDEKLNPVLPLYNYLKPFPESLHAEFYKKYGGEQQFSLETASPVLGNLNSGLQLYRLKHERPRQIKKVKYSLHLPNYLAAIISGEAISDITSIGCHTAMWDFNKNKYHHWLREESVLNQLAPIASCTHTYKKIMDGKEILVGTGMHDSSAALIPYLMHSEEPFVLISTGTWCISLNPFNHAPLTAEELAADCLCYLQYQGEPVKASRLFSGNEHDAQVKRISAHFHVSEEAIIKEAEGEFRELSHATVESRLNLEKNGKFNFRSKDLSGFNNYTTAYHELLMDLVIAQMVSTNRVLKNTTVNNIYVDGGFSRNKVFMQFLREAYPHMNILAGKVPQSTALGAALVIHDSWNSKKIPSDILELNKF